MNSAAQPLPPETSSSSSVEGVALAVPKPLTEKQQRVWDMRRPVAEGGQGKSRAEIAAELGISKPVVSKTLQAIYKKLGLSRGKSKTTILETPEIKRPEATAAALVAASDPWSETKKEAIERVNAMLKAEGIPDKVSEALVRRLKVKYAGAVYAAKELRTGEILEMLGKKIDLCAFYLDDKVLSEASARDIMLGMSALIEKRNLLRGEPTQIVSDAERAKLHELVPLLIQEAKRRGLTVEGQITEKTVESA